MGEGDKFEVLLSDRLREDSTGVEDITGYDATRELDDRANSYEYIMHGVIFKYAQEKSKA